MRGVQLAELTGTAPSGVEAALDVVAGFDGALLQGLGRLDATGTSALAGLAGAVAATPLGPRVAEAVEKITAGSIADDSLALLAGARSALLGAVHDALLAQLDAARGRERRPWTPPAGGAPEGSAGAAAPGGEGPLAGARSWLTEVAITGWRGVDADSVAAAAQVVSGLLAAPGRRRLAVLLDGLVAELRAGSPLVTLDRVPARRWGDLWSRAVLLARPGDGAPSGGNPAGTNDGATDGGDAVPAGPGGSGGETVSGRLLVLGVDVHEHPTAVQAQVHAILEPTGGAPSRLVRTSVAAAKVDTVLGPTMWQLLGDHPVLLGALAHGVGLEVTDLVLRPGGDLIWRDDRARPAEPADPFAVARVQLGDVLADGAPPLDRHPAGIAEPVLLEGYTASRDSDGGVTFDVDGTAIGATIDRLPTCGPLTPELVAASSACIGLLRWDAGRWLVQPLAVQVATKRKTTVAQTGDWALGADGPRASKAAKATDAVSVLRERAGRLLRR
ncbi:hypothetical protein AB0J86_01800 [Micromonospora sp. NPDC049559]|uniref:hypothetical protein n=1 Tax=Micromonospora sp. NPDC049559 TaxID=3155923 RepID=UPI00342DF69C